MSAFDRARLSGVWQLAARYRLEAYLNDVVQRRGSCFSKVV